jgi:phosphate transport system permease protein
VKLRQTWDKLFTAAAYAVFIVVAAMLLVILVPILWRGGGAVVFKGTVEFRRMQLAEFGRGDPEAVEAEVAAARTVQAPATAMLRRFQRGLDTSRLEDEARDLYRDFGDELRLKDLPRKEERARKRVAKDVRTALLDAFAAEDKSEALRCLDEAASHRDDPLLSGPAVEKLFALVDEYRTIVNTVDLSMRAEYAAALAEVDEALHKLLGPFPGEDMPPVPMDQYGMTRWDRAQVHLERLLYAEPWVDAGPGQPRVKKRIPRTEQFAGTELAALFPLAERELEAMLRPRWTFYWQYFTDDSVSSHFFGGVGPEVVGTVLLTVLAILFAIPLGVISAAYLIECAGDNVVVLVIRTCINTLAGVPSIVFGLFGLAFFVLFFLPLFGLERGSSILAGGLTLGVLVLPVMIRASEEAIRAVPQTYKEAALSLGAGRFRAFVTVTLPAALPGILTGVILSMSRAAGETAPILFTAAVAMGAIPGSLFEPTRALPYAAYDIAVGDRLGPLVPHKQFGTVMTLVALVLLLNLAAILLRARISKKLRGQ